MNILHLKMTKDKISIYKFLKSQDLEKSAVVLFCIAPESQIRTNRHTFFQVNLFSLLKRENVFHYITYYFIIICLLSDF